MSLSAALKDRGDKLRSVCLALEGVPTTWGVDDCSTWPASWVAGVTGRDVFWPPYTSEEEARAMIADAGSLMALWADVAHDCRLRRRMPGEEPQLGDVGIIATTYHGPEVGVVFAHGRTACWRHAEGGVRRLSVRHKAIVACWEVPL